jgi:AcrR family transcriptional regulator
MKGVEVSVPAQASGLRRRMQNERVARAVSSPKPDKPPALGARVRRNYRKGEETQERMISAALDTVYELGFSKASSREIARRSGVTFGVIQHHFGNFESLLLAACEQSRTGIRAMLAGAEVKGVTTEEKLTFIADLVWKYFSGPVYISYLEIFTNLSRDPATSEQTRKKLRSGTREVEKLWLDLMLRTFGPGHHDLVLMRLLFGTMQGLAVMRWMNNGRLNLAQERRLFVAAVAAYQVGLDSTNQTPVE